MKTLTKILDVMAKNWLYTALLIVSLIIFAWFADRLIPALIPAISGLIAYICGDKLYTEFKKKKK